MSLCIVVFIVNDLKKVHVRLHITKRIKHAFQSRKGINSWWNDHQFPFFFQSSLESLEKPKNQDNKLAKIKLIPTPWSSSNRTSRRQEIALTKLRIGHTRLTHSHLIITLVPVNCPKCEEYPLSIYHIYLFTCQAFTYHRNAYPTPHKPSLALRNHSTQINNTSQFLPAATNIIKDRNMTLP